MSVAAFLLFFFPDTAKVLSRSAPEKLFPVPQVVPVGSKWADFAAGRFSVPKKVLLGLVGLEAARLSKSNRQRTVTLQEVATAVTLILPKTRTGAAA